MTDVFNGGAVEYKRNWFDVIGIIFDCLRQVVSGPVAKLLNKTTRSRGHVSTKYLYSTYPYILRLDHLICVRNISTMF